MDAGDAGEIQVQRRRQDQVCLLLVLPLVLFHFFIIYDIIFSGEGGAGLQDRCWRKLFFVVVIVSMFLGFPSSL